MAGFFGGFILLDDEEIDLVSSSTNDLAINSSRIEIVPQADMDEITGLDKQFDLGTDMIGPLVLLINIHATRNLVLKHNDSNSASANRIFMSNGADLIVPPFNTVILGWEANWFVVRVPDSVPPGTIQMWGGATAPHNWFLCDGSAVSRTSYAGLFASIGTTFGTGDGSTTFNLPNLTQRFPLGLASSGTGSTLGGTGGTIDHTHNIDHTHQIDPPSTNTSTPSASISNVSLLGVGGAATDTHTHSVDIAEFASGAASTSNSGSANPPFIALNFIIKI